MQLIEVSSRRDSRRFIRFPAEHYKNKEVWIRPIDKEIEGIFDPAINNSFERGSCQRWILVNKDEIIGRIAAFIVENTSDNMNARLSGIGYFECIDDQQAANKLFDVAKQWLMDKGAEFMDGPINFGRRDRWWGLLTKGYELEPNYQCNYNFPYYKELFENYGFQVYYEHFTFVKKIHEPLHPRLQYKADMISEDPGYTFKYLDLNNYREESLNIIDIYNKAWVNHEGVATLTETQGAAIFKQLKPIIDEKIVWLAYYHGEPVAFYVNIPEINQLFKYVNGKLNWLGKLKFLWHKMRKKNKKMLGIIFGVVPEHQGKGLDGAIILACYNMLQSMSRKYEIVEINGIGDFNRKMIIVVKQVGGEICKVHSTYRYLFDRTKEFERMKAI